MNQKLIAAIGIVGMVTTIVVLVLANRHNEVHRQKAQYMGAAIGANVASALAPFGLGNIPIDATASMSDGSNPA